MEQVKAVQEDPLESLQEVTFSSRRALVDRFNDPKTNAHERKELLHIGFDVPVSQRWMEKEDLSWIDLVHFYLSVADGYSRDAERLVKKSFENRSPHGLEDCKKVLRLKAWDVLCMKVFEPWTENQQTGGWSAWSVTLRDNPRFAESIIRFFTASSRSLWPVGNIPRRDCDHNNDQRALKFLKCFSEHLWSDKKCGSQAYLSDETLCVFKELRIQLIQLLLQIGALDILMYQKRDQWMTTKERQCLTTLALRRWRSTNEVYPDIGAALLDGSSAAEVLVVLNARRSAHAKKLRVKRVEARVRAEESRREEHDRLLAERSSLDAKLKELEARAS